MTQISPLNDRIVVKRLENEEKTKGGIIIPDTAKEKAQYGEVVAAGPGKANENGAICPLSVKQGDKVLFGKYSGTEINFDGQDLLIIREDEVLGILK